MKSAKAKIKKCVEHYIKLCPDEYQLFLDGMASRKQHMQNNFAEIKALRGSTEMRGLHEMPQTLWHMIDKALTEEEMLWFKLGNDGKSNDGGRWFAKTFPKFAIPWDI